MKLFAITCLLALVSCASSTAPTSDATRGYLGVWHESHDSRRIGDGSIASDPLTLTFTDSVTSIMTQRGNSWTPSKTQLSGPFPSGIIMIEWNEPSKDRLWLKLNATQDSLLAVPDAPYSLAATAFNR